MQTTTTNGPPTPLSLRDDSRAFEPTSIDECYRLAKILHAGRILPKGITTPEAAFTIIVAGREFGLTAMQSVRMLFSIDGKIGMYADLAVGLVKQRPICEQFQLIESTPKIATYRTKRKGEDPTTMSFTIEEATVAGLTGKGTWKSYPAAMLRARASMALARAVYPDVVGGLYDPDELTDNREPPQRIEVSVTPAEPSSKPVIEGVAEPDEREIVDGFTGRIAKAKTTQDLSRVGVAIEKAKGKLSPTSQGDLRALYVARKTALGKPQPVPPPSEPAPVAPEEKASATEAAFDEVTGELAGRQPGED
jgi:hypothetical protein